MSKSAQSSGMQSWISLGLASAVFATCFFLFSDAHAATTPLNEAEGGVQTLVAAPAPEIMVGGLLAMAGALSWLALRGERRLW